MAPILCAPYGSIKFYFTKRPKKIKIVNHHITCVELENFINRKLWVILAWPMCVISIQNAYFISSDNGSPVDRNEFSVLQEAATTTVNWQH